MTSFILLMYTITSSKISLIGYAYATPVSFIQIMNEMKVQETRVCAETAVCFSIGDISINTDIKKNPVLAGRVISISKIQLLHTITYLANVLALKEYKSDWRGQTCERKLIYC